jgi:hypothetical protein
MGIVLDDHAFESALEQMAVVGIQRVESIGVSDSKPLHAFGKITAAGSQQQMVVIVHQHVGGDVDLEALGHLSQSV